MKQHTARVISNRMILSGVICPPQYRPRPRPVSGSYLLWLRCPEIASEALPGQFTLVYCDDGSILPRPFSIHQTSDDSLALFFTVWGDGRGTPWLSRREADDTIKLLGPLGRGYEVYPATGHLLLVSGGAGIAPLVFLAQTQRNLSREITLLMGAQRSSQLYPQNLLPPGIKVVVATDDGSAGSKGLVTALLPEHIDRADQVFACGPVGMYRDLARREPVLLKGKPTQLSLDSRMACGHGVCHGCTIETRNGLKQICNDGPVFEMRDIADVLLGDSSSEDWLRI